MFVLLTTTFYQDETQEHVVGFKSKEHALEHIKKSLNGWCKERQEFHLFELGKEIPLEFGETVEEQVIETKTKTVKLKGKK